MAIPDAQVHHEATGTAKPTVDAHSAEKPLKLYAGWFCPFVQRCWMVLEEKKIPYQYIEVNPYHKPKSLLDLNPRGLVPTLQYHDKPLYESTVISDFLDEVYHGYGPDLYPSDSYDKARMRIWSDWVTSRFIPCFFRFLQQQPSKSGGSDDDLAEVRKEFLGLIKDYTKEMDADGPYFAGPEPLMVDFTIAPFAMRLFLFEHFKHGLGMPETGTGGADEKVWARWRKFVSAISARESVKATTSEQQYYMPVYQRYADDEAQSEMAKATRKGRGVP